jgi:hypothetical protein
MEEILLGTASLAVLLGFAAFVQAARPWRRETERNQSISRQAGSPFS